MRIVQPQINRAVAGEVVGAIYASENLDDLSEDMLEVLLPDGVQICAGWSSSDRAYRVTATQGMASLRSPYTTADPDEAASCVEQWVAELNEQRSHRAVG